MGGEAKGSTAEMEGEGPNETSAGVLVARLEWPSYGSSTSTTFPQVKPRLFPSTASFHSSAGEEPSGCEDGPAGSGFSRRVSEVIRVEVEGESGARVVLSGERGLSRNRWRDGGTGHGEEEEIAKRALPTGRAED
jgi:hypothetical protein